MNWIRTVSAIFVCVLIAATLSAQSTASSGQHWVAVWTTAQEMAVSVQERPVLPPDVKMPDFSKMKMPPGLQIPEQLENQTVRMIVHTSLGGTRLRVELTNGFGKGVVSIGAAHIAVRAKDSSIESGTDRVLTFSNSPKVEIRPGAVILSDPVELTFSPMADLAVSLYVVKSEGKPTNHVPGLHTVYISSGNTAASPSVPDATTTSTAYLWLRGVDVEAPAADFAIACMGDSITDGYGTTVDANQTWPALLAKRLSEAKTGPHISVLNQGISGNQLLRNGAGVSALARFDRDVLGEPGVRWVVLLEGINDINIHGQITGPDALTANDLIEGYKQIIARSHLHNIKIMGGTLTPDLGVWPGGPIGEATREIVNQWIRTSGQFDAIVDFDAALRDSVEPKKLRAEFDSNDHIHPSDRGHAAMAETFDLSVFLK